MSRLLTGYAVSFNRRYRRHGHLFQNRYKSILRQEDLYLKELGTYFYCGHSALNGKAEHGFQDVDYVLNIFGGSNLQARRQYWGFVKKGVEAGRRPDLTGGGLVRSAGGWSALRTMRKAESRMKGDERILGEGDFVESVLKAAREDLDRKSVIQARGYDLGWLMDRVTDLFGLTLKDIVTGGKQRRAVKARSVYAIGVRVSLGSARSRYRRN